MVPPAALQGSSRPPGGTACPGAVGAAAAGTQTGLVRRLLALATQQAVRLAVAESLTGGLLAAAVVAEPGASQVLRGAVVAYATEIKAQVLGVEPGQLARTGPVDAEVARQMAAGAASLLGAEMGLSTTGVAGPGPADGHRAGTVHVAAWSRDRVLHRALQLPGDRQQVREAAVMEALRLGVCLLESWPGRPGKQGQRPDAHGLSQSSS